MKISGFCLNAALLHTLNTVKADCASWNSTCTSKVSMLKGSPGALTKLSIVGRNLASLHLINNLCFFYINWLTIAKLSKIKTPVNCSIYQAFFTVVKEKSFSRAEMHLFKLNANFEWKNKKMLCSVFCCMHALNSFRMKCIYIVKILFVGTNCWDDATWLWYRRGRVRPPKYLSAIGCRACEASLSNILCSGGCRGWSSSPRAWLQRSSSRWWRQASHSTCWFLSLFTRSWRMLATANCKSRACWRGTRDRKQHSFFIHL